jgi:hypothetical protein
MLANKTRFCIAKSETPHSTSRTGHGPINLATIRSAIINAIRDAGYLHGLT